MLARWILRHNFQAMNRVCPTPAADDAWTCCEAVNKMKVQVGQHFADPRGSPSVDGSHVEDTQLFTKNALITFDDVEVALLSHCSAQSWHCAWRAEATTKQFFFSPRLFTNGRRGPCARSLPTTGRFEAPGGGLRAVRGHRGPQRGPRAGQAPLPHRRGHPQAAAPGGRPHRRA